MNTSVFFCLLAFFSVLLAPVTVAADVVKDLKREIEDLRREVQKKRDERLIGTVETRTSAKYGPNNPVQTKAGKLNIGGLMQVWYQSVANDQLGLNRFVEVLGDFNSDAIFIGESNDTFDNDTFRIRRTELRLTMDITDQVSAYVMIDPARETNIQFAPLPTLFVRRTPLSNVFFLQTGAGLQSGNQITPQMLQDAYINFHDIVPYHDFTLGQFKPPSGEESWRNSGQLEFVERSIVSNVNNNRDIGAMVHGSFLDGRVQYWAGLFNGPTETIFKNPDLSEAGNRSDDNDEKDFAWRVLFRPVWDREKWYGRLELGYARTDGVHGEQSSEAGRNTPINGLNKEKTDINRNSAWAWYRPAGPVRGWWLRGEWGSGRDRFYQGFSFVEGPANWLNFGDTDFGAPNNPKPVTLAGWTFNTGYKLSDSIFAQKLEAGGMLSKFVNNLEFAFRYEVFDAVVVESVSTPDRNSDIYKTQVVTAGINYYIKGHDAKIQANYLWVDEPDIDTGLGFREIRNDVFVVNFQFMF